MNHKIIEMYKNGQPISEISRRLKYSVFIVNRVLRDHGIIKKQPEPIPYSVVVDFVGHVSMGGSMESFALKSGFSVYRLKKAAARRRENVDIALINEVAEKAKENLELGLTIKQALGKELEELNHD